MQLLITDVVGTAPVDAAPTTSSFSTEHFQWIWQRQLQDETKSFLKFWDFVRLILRDLTVCMVCNFRQKKIDTTHTQAPLLADIICLHERSKSLLDPLLDPLYLL